MTMDIFKMRNVRKGRSRRMERIRGPASRDSAAVTHPGNTAVAQLAEAQLRGLRAHRVDLETTTCSKRDDDHFEDAECDVLGEV